MSRELGITAARASRWRDQFLAAGQAGLKSRAPDARDEDHRRLQAKIDHLCHVRYPTTLAEDDVGRFDVPVNETDLVRLGQRSANLPENMNDAARLLRSRCCDELFQIKSLEILHRVVEDPVRRASVVEDGDGARMAEACRQLHLTLEPLDTVFSCLLGAEQLDGRGSP